IADICGDGFIRDGIRRMDVANEVPVFDKQVRTEDERFIRLNVENGGIISYWDDHRRFESLPDFPDETAFTELIEFHTVASAPLRRRRGPRTTFAAFLLSSNAALKTL